jgi:hypothetical protein
VVNETADRFVGIGNSPILPACVLSFVAVPLMPTVLDGETRPVAESVVNAPVLGVVAPTDVLLMVPPEIVGVPIVGDVPKTRTPEPVSSLMTPASCVLVVAANCANVPVVVAEFA